MVTKYQLKNGLQVLLVESHRAPVLSAHVWVRTGSAHEQRGEEGISHFIEHLVFKGTEKYGPGEIAGVVEAAGGELNAYTSFDQTVFHVTISQEFSETALDVLSQMMGAPTFDATEIDNEREVVIEEIKRSMDSPHRRASRLLFSSAYAKHPYSIPVIGYEMNIRELSVAKIRSYFESRYTPENMTLVVVGSFVKKDMRRAVERFFGGLVQRRTKAVRLPAWKPRMKSQVVVEEGGFEEDLFYLAWPIPPGAHRQIPQLDILSMVLGQGESSRLMRGLRNEKHLTNYAAASTFTPTGPGLFVVSASLHFDKRQEMLRELLSLLQEFLHSGPTEEELEKAKFLAESERYYSMETVDGLAQVYGSYEFMFGDYHHFNETLKEIRQLKREDLKRVARRYLAPEHLTLSLLATRDGEACRTDLQSWVREYRQAFNTKPAKNPALRGQLRWSPAKGKASEELRKVALPGGAQLVLRPIADSPVVSLRCAFLGGGLLERAPTSGVNDLLSRVWTAGTKNMSEAEINEKIESLAARLHAFGGRSTAGLAMTALAPVATQVLDLFLPCLVNPVFPEVIVEREKDAMLESLKHRADQVAQKAILLAMQKLFAGHSYGLDPQGTPETVADLNRQKVAAHYEAMLGAQNLHFVLAGDFHAEEWEARLAEAVRQLPEGKRWQSRATAPALAEEESLFEASKKEQTHLTVIFPGLRVNDPERYTLEVLQSVLSGQGGRLFLELRDKASLAYSVAPIRMDGWEGGYFGAYIGCSPEKASRALQMMYDEFEKLMTSVVSEKELSRAKKYLIGRHDIALQKTSAVVSSILFDDVYGLPFDESFHYADRIRQVQGSDVMALAVRLFDQPAVRSAIGQISPFS